MAKFSGNIFNRARGSIGGNTFSQARYRKGKLQTGRQRVTPANPKTPAQESQRDILAACLAIVRNAGQIIYRNQWNNQISKLPGYQSLMSVLMHMSSTTTEEVDVSGFYPTIQSGELHFPNTIVFNPSAVDNTVEINWSTELGTNGKSTDQFFYLIWTSVFERNIPYDRPVLTLNGTVNRSAGTFTTPPLLAVSPSNPFSGFFWFYQKDLEAQVKTSQIYINRTIT